MIYNYYSRITIMCIYKYTSHDELKYYYVYVHYNTPLLRVLLILYHGF